jgi:lipoprotein-releasing system ATP-binding protein
MAATAKEVLCARGIAKSFESPERITVLQEISLSVRQGESIAIVGRSGEGKSTLLNILGTLDTPDRGALAIAGQQVTRNNRAQLRCENIGFVFQAFNLLDHYTAIENVLMPARIGRKPCGKDSPTRLRALALLEQLDLADRANHDSRLLSGGEKQRVAIARALINEPDLILADEPTGNLDHTTSSKLQELLLHLSRGEGKALIVVTHDLELAGRCDRTYHLCDGVLQETQQQPKKNTLRRLSRV